MIATERTQSLSDFHEKSTEIINRLNATCEAEILTVNGEPRAVLLAPAVYDEFVREIELSRDVAMIRKSMQQIEAGQFQDSETFFEGLRSKLLAMKAAQEKGAA